MPTIIGFQVVTEGFHDVNSVVISSTNMKYLT